MLHTEKNVFDSKGENVGKMKYVEAGALVPVGQLQYEVFLLDPQGEKIGEIRKVRTTDVFVDWKGAKIRYPEDLTLPNAVLLGERLINKTPKNHEELIDVVNSFARAFYAKTPSDEKIGRA